MPTAARSRCTRCPTRARAFDNGYTYADRQADAVSKATQVLADVANSCPGTKFTIPGYSQGAEDLAILVSEGLSAASFFTSGTHTNYNSLVVDNAGRSAIQWISDLLNLQIGRVV